MARDRNVAIANFDLREYTNVRTDVNGNICTYDVYVQIEPLRRCDVHVISLVSLF